MKLDITLFIHFEIDSKKSKDLIDRLQTLHIRSTHLPEIKLNNITLVVSTMQGDCQVIGFINVPKGIMCDLVQQIICKIEAVIEDSFENSINCSWHVCPDL